MFALRRRDVVLSRSPDNISIASFRDCNFFANRQNKIEAKLLASDDSYDLRNFSVVTKFVHEGSVCLDVGANIGVYANVMARIAGQRGEIHAFEPVKHVRDKLRANLALNGFDGVRVNGFALGANEEVLDMYQVVEGEFRGGTSSLLRNENVQQMGEQKFQRSPVQVKRLDDYAREVSLEKLDFMKMDVEGFEWMVIKGGIETLQRNKPAILMEYDEARHREYTREIKEYFESQAYQVFEFMVFGSEMVLVPFAFDRNPVDRNIVCVSSFPGAGQGGQ